MLKPNFLKEHKTDIEQYPLAPTSTTKSFIHQPLDSIIVFKAKYLRLAGDASVSYVKARQKEVRLAGIAVKEAQEKSC